MDAGEIKADASRALASGDFARAAALYSTYCASAPTDRQSWLRMGDAWARAGNHAKAIDAYLAAAEGFAEDGFLARAIAASKLVLQLDPGHPRMQRILADLYTQRRTPFRARVPPPPDAPHPASGTAADVPGTPSAESTAPESADRRGIERVAPRPTERALEEALGPTRPAPRFDELSLDDSPQGLEPTVLHEVERVAGSLAEVSVPPPPPSPPSDPGVPQPPLFSDLPGAAFLELVERCPLLRFPAGGRILQQGTPGEDFFVVFRDASSCSGRREAW